MAVMDVKSFGSFEEAQEYLANAETNANAAVLPINREVEWGSHWWRYVEEYDFFIFGEVWAEGYSLEYGKGTPAYDEAEATYENDAVNAAHARGYRYGRAYSVVEPDGELGSTHIVEMFPMSPEEFARARDAGWNVRDDDGQLLPWFAVIYMRTRERYITEAHKRKETE